MLRAAGIPARVVTGYQGGKMSNGYMIVRQSDAHAWAEAYIDNKWQRFDPTAAVAPQRVELGASDALRNDSSQNLIDKIEIPYLSAFASDVALKWDADRGSTHRSSGTVGNDYSQTIQGCQHRETVAMQ